MKIPTNRLDRPFLKQQHQFEEAALRVLRSGWYVLGKEVASFEDEFKQYIGASHCVGLASGLDALWIATRLLGIGPGDEVIVQANAYIACVMGITINGAEPVFVEPDEYYQIDVSKIASAITSKTKAVMVVHLYGQTADMGAIMKIAKKHNLYVLEDCAQSHGSKQGEIASGNFGDVGCFSFYPSKNLGAFGDAGAVTCGSESLAEEFKVFRNYGSEKRYHNRIVGTNSRLDELQAALLRTRLSFLDQLNQERQETCERYLAGITHDMIRLPKVRPGCTSVWHQFVIQIDNRARFIEYLNRHEIGSIIHYPIPPHLAEAYEYLGHGLGDFPITEQYADTILSLPLYNGMTIEEQEYVIKVINNYG